MKAWDGQTMQHELKTWKTHERFGLKHRRKPLEHQNERYKMGCDYGLIP
jgi:hypothetical protein